MAGRVTPPEALRGAAETYETKSKEYGDNYKQLGSVMAAFFPRGLTIKTPEDWNKLHLFLLAVVKKTRFSQNWDKGHPDSLLDDMVYTAMLAEVSSEASVPAPKLPEVSGDFMVAAALQAEAGYEILPPGTRILEGDQFLMGGEWLDTTFPSEGHMVTAGAMYRRKKSKSGGIPVISPCGCSQHHDCKEHSTNKVEIEFAEGALEEPVRRQTFEVPEGYVAVRDEQGRATGEISLIDKLFPEEKPAAEPSWVDE